MEKKELKQIDKALEDLRRLSDRALEGQLKSKGEKPEWYKGAIEAVLKERAEKRAGKKPKDRPSTPASGDGAGAPVEAPVQAAPAVEPVAPEAPPVPEV